MHIDASTPFGQRVAQRLREDVVIWLITTRPEAVVDHGALAAKDHAGYAEKYREAFTRIGATPERFSERYSLPIRVKPTTLRGH